MRSGWAVVVLFLVVGVWGLWPVTTVRLSNADTGLTCWLPMEPGDTIRLRWTHSFDLTPVIEEFRVGPDGGWQPTAVHYKTSGYDAREQRYAGLPVQVRNGYFVIEGIEKLYPQELSVLTVRVGHTVKQSVATRIRQLALYQMGQAGELIRIQPDRISRFNWTIRRITDSNACHE